MLKKHINESNKDVYLCGHSSGGAKAILLAYALAHQYKHITFKVYVFGTPKVGNKDFYVDIKSLTNIEITSIKFSDDIVPYLGLGIHNAHNEITLLPKDVSCDFITAHHMIRYEQELIRQHETYTENEIVSMKIKSILTSYFVLLNGEV